MTCIRNTFLAIALLAPQVASQIGDQYIFVLGIAQDGGYPHIGCTRECCELVNSGKAQRKSVVSLAVVDETSHQWWLIEATPDMPSQIEKFRQLTGGRFPYLPAAVFLTHAHIGHYTGLMYFGREALGAKRQKVYALPRMKTFLETNGPWSQLVDLENIALDSLSVDRTVKLSNNAAITAFKVPHRDEFSETAGFEIQMGKRKALFIPDIDQWQRFDRSIVDLVKNADLAFLDASFYSADELPNRAVDEIPHPLITQTMELFQSTDAKTRNKIIFIHFNHSNPALWNSAIREKILGKGFRLATENSRY